MSRILYLPDNSHVVVADHVSDSDALSVARQRYPDAFAAPQEVAAPKTPEKRTWGEAITDTGAGLAKGIGSLMQLPSQAAGLITGDMEPGMLGRAGKAVEEFGQGLKSQPLLAKEAALQKRIQEAYETGGVGKEAITAIGGTLKDPALLTSFLAEQIPNFVGSLGTGLVAKLGVNAAKSIAGVAAKEAAQSAAKAGVGASVASGIAMQATDVGAETYQQVYDRLKQTHPEMDDAQMRDFALSRGRTAAAQAAAISGATQFIPGAQSIEKAILARGLGKEGASEVARQLAKKEAAKGAFRRGAEGFAGEALQEGIEEGPGGQLLTNLALQQADPTQRLGQGVGAATGMGAIAGGIFGGIGGVSNRAPAPPPSVGDAEGFQPTPFDQQFRSAVAAFSQRVEDPSEAVYAAAAAVIPNIKAGDEMTVFGHDGTAKRAQVTGVNDTGAPLLRVEGDRQYTLGQEFSLINPMSPAYKISSGETIGKLADDALQQKADLIYQELVRLDEAGVYTPQVEVDSRDLTALMAEQQRRAQKPDESRQEDVPERVQTPLEKLVGEAASNVDVRPTPQQGIAELAPGVKDVKAIFAEAKKAGQPTGLEKLAQKAGEPVPEPAPVIESPSLSDVFKGVNRVSQTPAQKIAGEASKIPEQKATFETPSVEDVFKNVNRAAQTKAQGLAEKATDIPLPVAEPQQADPNAIFRDVKQAALKNGLSEAAATKMAEAARKQAENIATPNLEAAVEDMEPDLKEIFKVEKAPVAKEQAKPTPTPSEAKQTQPAAPEAVTEPVKEAQTTAPAQGAVTAEKSKAEDRARKKREDDAKAVGESNAIAAFDQVGEYDNIEDSIASYRQNVTDTLVDNKEKDQSVIDVALKAFDDKVEDLKKAGAEKAKAEAAAKPNVFAGKSLDEYADEIGKMSARVRDNTDIVDLPGGYRAYQLYEAKKILKGEKEKFKRVTDKNSFDLSTSFDYVINVDGEVFGITKQEDPDDPDNPRAFVYSYENISKAGTSVDTVISDSIELLDALKNEVKGKKSESQVAKTEGGKFAYPETEAGALLKKIHGRINKERFEQARARVGRLVAERAKQLGLAKYVNTDLLSNIDEGGAVAGSYLDKLIKLAISGRTDTEIMSVFNHESVHAMRELGMITDQEWKNLSAVVKNKGWIKLFNLEERAKMSGLDEEAQIEEAIADAFATYVTGRSPVVSYDQNDTPQYVYREQLKLAGQPVGIIKRIMRMLGLVKDAANQEGLTEAIFKRFETPIEPTKAAVAGAPKFSVAPKTSTDAFKNWFKNSQVVNADGTPRVMYHGTGYDIRRFEQSRGDLIFFAKYPSMAEVYAKKAAERAEEEGAYSPEDRQGGPSIYPVYLSAQKLFDPDNQKHLDAIGANKDKAEGGIYYWVQDNADAIRDAGFDGVLVRERGNESAAERDIAVFEPTQVKSATGNVGTFDPRNPDIRYSVAPRTAQNAWEVSTAFPTAKKPLPGQGMRDPVNQFLIIDSNDIREVKAHFDAVTNAIASYNTLYEEPDADKRLKQLHEVVVDNLTWLYDKMPAVLRERAKLWYDGANRIANEMAAKYGYTPQQVSGVMAILSPQKDWFMNVSLGERLITIFKERQNESWTPAMTQWVNSWVAAAPNKAERESRTETARKMEAAKGKMLKDLNNLEAAYFIRVFDETYNPRQYRIVTPEGGFLGFVTNNENEESESDDAEPGSVAWNGFGNIEKGVSILRGGSFENISKDLGEMHKVRNFFNNIMTPGSEAGHVTIDTHAIAAALFKALSFNSLEVAHNFGSSPKGIPGAGGSNATGASGTYGLFADAYRDAAARIAARDGVSLLPRELQSITWEAIRNIFPAAWKSKNAPAIEAIWDKMRAGEITREEARKQVEELSRSRNKENKLLEPFAWEGVGNGSFVKDGGMSFDQDINPVIAKRKARVLPPKVIREKLNISMSAATSKILGVAQLYKMAKNGSAAAHKLLQEVAYENVKYLLGGIPEVRISYNPVTGLYGGAIEPSIGLTITMPEKYNSMAMAALRKFAENFDQEQIHVRENTNKKVGHVFEDGSYVTPVYRWELNSALSQQEIQRIIDRSGIAGLAVGDEYIETYFLGDPESKGEDRAKEISEFIARTERVGKLLGERVTSVGRSSQRIWAYGNGWGATHGYGQISGDLPSQSGLKNETIRKIADFLMSQEREAAIGKGVEGAEKLPKKVKSVLQEAALSPKQDALQSMISKFHDLLPDNDLKNKLVKAAYEALNKALLAQYRVIPAKLELIGDRDEDNNLRDMYGSKSGLMREDIRLNNHMYVFPTTPESFGPKGEDFSGHPLLKNSGIKDVNGRPMLFNDILRAVHDYYAHGMEENAFGPLGEEGAWKTHMSMTNDPLARWALTMETRAQNSWVNFREGLDRTMPLKDRPFARQKAALLPVEFALTGIPAVDRPMKEFISELSPQEAAGSKVKDQAAFNRLMQEHRKKKKSGEYPKYSVAPRYSATRILGGNVINATFNNPKTDFTTDLIYNLQDRFIDLKRLQGEITRTVGGLGDGVNVYDKEALFHNKVAKQTKDFLQQEIRPIVKKMEELGVSMDEMDKYLLNRHAKERNEQIAKVNPTMPDKGSGVTTADSLRYLAAIPAAKKRDLNAVASMIDAVMKGTRDQLVDGGLEDQATINDWERTYKHYVPLQREIEGEESGTGMGQGFSISEKTRRAMGATDLNVQPIFAQVVAARERAIVRSEKNHVAKAMYGLALKAPNPDFYLAVDPSKKVTTNDIQYLMREFGLTQAEAENVAKEPRVRRVNPTTGIVEAVVNPTITRMKDNVLHLMIDGKEKIVIFNPRNPEANRLAKSLKNIHISDLNKVMSFMAIGTRYFSMLATQLNPVFGIINLMRDIQGGLLNLTSTPLADKKEKIFRDTFPAIKGVWKQLRAEASGQTTNDPWAQLFEQFEKAGGPTGYRQLFADLAARNKDLEKEFEALRRGKAKKSFYAIYNAISDYNTAFENGMRLAAFKAALGKGMSEQQAANIAKNLTVNFNRKGAVTTQMNSLYAFFNASVQGTTRIVETLKGPTGKKIIGGALTLGVFQAMALAAAGFDDDQPPEFIKEKNIVIPTFGLFGEGKYFTIPMPLGFNVIPNFSRVLTEVALNGGKDWHKKIPGLLGATISGFNPLGGGLGAQTFAPTVVDPLIALAENKDAFGRKIYKEDVSGLRPTPGYTRTKETATPWAKGLAEFLNYASGGSEMKAGLINVTPDQIDYLVGQATGGVGREIGKAAQLAATSVTGEELPTYKIPLVSRFYGDTKEKASESAKFYENLKRVNEHAAQIKYLRTHQGNVSEYFKEFPEARLATFGSHTSETIERLNKQRKLAIERDMPRERVKHLEDLIQVQMGRFNERMKAVQ